jgi:hypothetical protein
LIRLLNSNDPLHGNAKDYFRHFLSGKITLKCSTISIAEYCVRGRITELPLRNLQILPFNFHHAVRAGEIMACIWKQKEALKQTERQVVINDVKLFAQADSENEIDGFITSDTSSKKLFETANAMRKLSFAHYDINTPCHEAFGFLPLT